jgi:hypothetical protein
LIHPESEQNPATKETWAEVLVEFWAGGQLVFHPIALASWRDQVGES